jgi:hypothetical protein
MNSEAWDQVCAFVRARSPDDLHRAVVLNRLTPWDYAAPEGTPADWREDRRQLRRLQKALNGLSPGARACLTSAFGYELKSTTPTASLKAMINAADNATTLAGRHIKRGRPRCEVKRRLADEIASIYFELTGKKPPTTQVVGNDPADCPYHQLARDVFAAWGLLDGWGHNARQAAYRLAEKSCRKVA